MNIETQEETILIATGIDKHIEGMVADFSSDAELTPELKLQRRERIVQLEKSIASLPQSYGMHEFNEGKIQHHFATGVYGRELFIPKGNVIVSKIHRGKTLNIIASGVISVISERGHHTYEGPYVFVSDPYTKRVVISHEDTLWITAHGTHKTDLEEVEEEVIAKDFMELQQGENV